MKSIRSLFLCAMLAAGGVGAAQAQSALRDLPDFARLVEEQGNAVVNISTTQAPRQTTLPQIPGLNEEEMQEFFRRFVPRSPAPGAPRQESRSLGSGFFVSADGYILTNAHVVDGAQEITVRLTDKREFKSRLIGADRRTDVAVLKIDASNMPTVRFGDSARLRVGEWVIAIGSPFGFENTVTQGIVSAKGRSLPQENFVPFIQTDVAINPGNSGGPLFNMRGEVIGINSQIYSRTGGFMGISFAIPIDEAMRVVEQLRTTGRVIRGRIGVAIAEVTREVAAPLGLPTAAGALVRSVESGGPAERAGIEAGDIILRFDGKPIERASDLPRMVGGTRPGMKVPLQVWRRGEKKDLSITVAEMEPERTASQGAGPKAPESGAHEKAAASPLGLAVSDLSAERKQQLRLRHGVLVDVSDGPAARAGIRSGDIILTINNQEVSNARRFGEIVARLDRAKAAVLLVRRGDAAQFVPVRPEAR
ncbi:MAG: DegQ family serine endoprotease [Burkholderiaceae bacterium]|nr:DegQ family serine endoprotease [Burkholderiaceae bacterium]